LGNSQAGEGKPVANFENKKKLTGGWEQNGSNSSKETAKQNYMDVIMCGPKERITKNTRKRGKRFQTSQADSQFFGESGAGRG